MKFGFFPFYKIGKSPKTPQYTLLGTSISHPKALLKMIFLFPRWDMFPGGYIPLQNIGQNSSSPHYHSFIFHFSFVIPLLQCYLLID